MSDYINTLSGVKASPDLHGSYGGVRGTNPGQALEDAQDLLLCDWLVGGLGVGLGGWRKNGVDVDVDEGQKLCVERRGRLAQLSEDPVLRVKTGHGPNGLKPTAGPRSSPHPGVDIGQPTLMETLCLVKALLLSSW